MDPNLDDIARWIEIICPGRSDEVTVVPSNGSGVNSYQVLGINDSLLQVKWNPLTLKEVLDHALRLSKNLRNMTGLMAFLADQEEALRTLRNEIQAPVKQSSAAAPKALCIVFDGSPRIVGRWVPDLIDRAGGQPTLLEPGDLDAQLNSRDIITAGPDVLFFGFDSTTPDSESTVLSPSNCSHKRWNRLS